MKKLPTKTMVLLLIAFLLFTLLPSLQARSATIKTFVSILPQAYFVERVGGQFVGVEVLVGAGQSPATYEPTPKQMARLGRAQVYFRIGTPFEQGFITKLFATFNDLKIVDTRNGVTLRYFGRSKGLQVPDPHIWLDRKRVKIQAGTVCTALSLLDPVHTEDFGRNMRAFMADLDKLDATISDILSPLRGNKFYVFHPAFGYFGDSYGLKQVAVEIEGKEPTAKQLSKLIEKAKADGVKVIFVQPQYAKRDAEAIAKAIGGAVVPMNPLPRNYLESMEDMANILRKSILRQ